MAAMAREVSRAFARSVPVRWPTPLLLGPGWWMQPQKGHIHQGSDGSPRVPEVATGWVHRQRPPWLKLVGESTLDSSGATTASSAEIPSHDANTSITMQDVLLCAAKRDIAAADVLLGAVIEVVLPTVPTGRDEQSDGRNLLALLSSGPRA